MIGPESSTVLLTPSPTGFLGECGSHSAAKPSRESTKASKIMIVDDEPTTVKAVMKYLRDRGYVSFLTTSDATQAFSMMQEERPDTVLLDVRMPEVSGLEILRQMRSDGRLEHVPVLILTADTDGDTRREALELGATDFLTKPVDASELVLRVRNLLVVKAHQDHLANYSGRLEHQVRMRTMELISSRKELVQSLARAAEMRDNETGNHIIRVGRYVGIIAREMGLGNEFADVMEEAALLHDVGKIAIPDSILLKPGKLSVEEYDAMKQHCEYGRRIIQQDPDREPLSRKKARELGNTTFGMSGSLLAAVAATIAHSHHEKWDGSGYPLGLAGEDIPIVGRITAVADVYDALSSKRPYKPAFPRSKCRAILEDGRGSHFDPQVLDAFFARIDDVVRVQLDYSDDGTDDGTDDGQGIGERE